MSKQRDWGAEVAAWRASGMSAQKFCQERGFSATRLYWWSSQLKRSGGSAVENEDVPMARVVRKTAVQGTTVRTPIVIHVGSARVEVVADTDRDTLAWVLQTLAEACSGVRS